MAYVGHDDPQYLYDECVAAELEARQAHAEYVAAPVRSGALFHQGEHGYWWVASRLAREYLGKLRYGLDGKPRDLSALDQWKIRVPHGD